MAKQKKTEQKSSGVSAIEKLRLRVSAMIGSPKAQADRRATIWRLDTDTDEAWNQVMEELAETDGLEMIRNEDGTVTLTWQPAEEGDDPETGAEDGYMEEQVVQRMDQEQAPF